jgi:hypothetical protein
MTSHFFDRIRIGIPAPETPEETNDQLGSVDGMRRAIAKAGRESHVIRNALDTARIRGLSGEDAYVLLAYQALRLLEDAHQRELHHLRHAPPPTFLVRKEDLPRG